MVLLMSLLSLLLLSLPLLLLGYCCRCWCRLRSHRRAQLRQRARAWHQFEA